MKYKCVCYVGKSVKQVSIESLLQGTAGDGRSSDGIFRERIGIAYFEGKDLPNDESIARRVMS